MSKTKLIFVRHGVTEGNISNTYQGRTDIDLNTVGREQARRVAFALKGENINTLYSSPLIRAHETARRIAKVNNVTITKLEQLKEIDGGDWEGKTFKYIAENWPEDYMKWQTTPHLHRNPNGESTKEFQDRLVNAVDEIVKENDGKNICIVTHGAAILVLMCHFYGYSLEDLHKVKFCENTGVSTVFYDSTTKEYEILKDNDFSHLDDDVRKEKILDASTGKEIAQKILRERLEKQFGKDVLDKAI